MEGIKIAASGKRISATSPASTGPAGSLFEGQVGAYYLLAMLARSEARGLPGAVVERIQFQGASDGRALDDVIVHATDTSGAPAILEIQVKRRLDFTPSDRQFQAVVSQIAAASDRADFFERRYELAVAIERTSTKIERHYQEVLSWARHHASPDSFASHMARQGYAHDDMRKFVDTFRANLELAGAAHDDLAVWRILKRFQILVFDFNQAGSSWEHWSRERAAMLLVPQDVHRAGNLWDELALLAEATAAHGGERMAAELREDLRTKHGYGWAGDRRLVASRNKLAEATAGALADIDCALGSTRIDRSRRVAQVYDALDQGRYVEVRGEPGVGKSGVLRHLAEKVGIEARAIVLSRDRTIPRGWLTLQSALGCDCTARELLSDLAGDGGAILLIDGIDFFDDDSLRTTVKDLVRAAAEVPGFAVVVTARADFGKAEPSWLPQSILNGLGPTQTVIIDELDNDEIAQLKTADSSLAALLADTHPARDVVRNLFLLSLLATRSPYQPIRHSEAGLADHWWRTAGGGSEASRRERLGVLEFLASQSVTVAGAISVSERQPTAVDFLVKNSYLRELHPNRVVFRHDVLRDWAVGCMLHADPARVGDLPLDRPAPARLVRGLEMAARLAAEQNSDEIAWSSLIDRLSRSDVHGSWRRAALLALVRSEIGSALLDRMSPKLLMADGGTLFLDLIRLTIATDSEPAKNVLSKLGVDLLEPPVDFLMPTVPSWARLVDWSLKMARHLPMSVVPAVADLFWRWSLAHFGRDPLTPFVVETFYTWLTEIEPGRHVVAVQGDLEQSLRTSFLAFCDRRPDLAEQYLRSVTNRPVDNYIAREVIAAAGAAPRAAPSAWADLVVRTLIPDSDEKRREWHDFEPFGAYDHYFWPPSPTRGSLLDLLNHSPSEGLRLVCVLLDHAIQHFTQGQIQDDEILIVGFHSGERKFSLMRSYIWSRGNARSSVVTSLLFALEAWGHQRIEAGEDVDTVLADIVGDAAAPAARLLVAVDLILSHWPQSREAARPLLACPELLALDHARWTHDAIGAGDLLKSDLWSDQNRKRDPLGRKKLEDLRDRPSRRIGLDRLIMQIAIEGPESTRQELRHALLEAAKRLGPPVSGSAGHADPAFAAYHALNLLDSANWKAVAVKKSDGSEGTRFQYEPPADETELLAPGWADALADVEAMGLGSRMASALEDAANSSPELVAKGLAWAQKGDVGLDKPEDRYLVEQRPRLTVMAATLAMRDGDQEQRSAHADWARQIFAEALHAKDDSIYRQHSPLTYNVTAIAAVGLIALLRHEPNAADRRCLLAFAVRSEASMAIAFGLEAGSLGQIDGRLPRAILRLGWAAQVYPRRNYDEPEETTAVRVEHDRRRLAKALEVEIAWLEGGQSEPAWPAFPAHEPKRKRPCSIHDLASGRPPDAVDHQGAALWLRMSAPLIPSAAKTWMRELVRFYATWTAAANGAGLEDVDDNELQEWNDAYFEIAVRTAVGLSPQETAEFLLNPIRELPDTPFFDVLPKVIRIVDQLYFDDDAISLDEAVRIRSLMAERLMRSHGWHWVTQRMTDRIEVHIGPAIGAFFMHDGPFFVRNLRCYLPPRCAARLEAFLPLLTDLAVHAARSIVVTTLFLNLIEVNVEVRHLRFLLKCVEAWQGAYPTDPEFWVAHQIGQRVSAWLDEAMRIDPDIFLTTEVDAAKLDFLLDAMVSAGVASARATEEALSSLREDPC